MIQTQVNFFEYIDQVVIAIVLIVFIVIFQMLLNQIIQFVKRYKTFIIDNNVKMNIDVQQNIVQSLLIQFNSFFVSMSSINHDIDSRLIEKATIATYEHEFFSTQTSII